MSKIIEVIGAVGIGGIDFVLVREHHDVGLDPGQRCRTNTWNAGYHMHLEHRAKGGTSGGV